MPTHRSLCIAAARWLLGRPGLDLACWELKYNRGFVDAIAVSTKRRTKNKKICIVEVKRTRSDLLQDLNKGKLLKYEKGSTHCYLAATIEALRLNTLNEKQCIEDLTSRGLPSHWGILVYSPDGNMLRSIRKVKKLRNAHKLTLQSIITRIGKSFMYKALA